MNFLPVLAPFSLLLWSAQRNFGKTTYHYENRAGSPRLCFAD
jgi:hypothetical protein